MRNDVARVLQYKGYTVGQVPGDGSDCVLAHESGSVVVVEWNHSDPQPDDAQVEVWAAEPGYVTWHNEHGGNEEATLRREAREALAGLQSFLIEIDKADNAATLNYVNAKLESIAAYLKLNNTATLSYTNAKLKIIADYLKTKFPADVAGLNAFMNGLPAAPDHAPINEFVDGLATEEQAIQAVVNRLNRD